MSDQPQTAVHEVDEQPVPGDCGFKEMMMRTIHKVNCCGTLEACSDQIKYFIVTGILSRLLVKCSRPDDVIMLINADDPNGREFAEVLIPNGNWQKHKDGEKVPFVGALVGRKWIEEILDDLDKEAADELRRATGITVVVVDHGVVEVFSMS